MTDDKDKQWTVLESEYLIRRPWLTARRDWVRLPNGVENNEYYVLEYPVGGMFLAGPQLVNF